MKRITKNYYSTTTPLAVLKDLFFSLYAGEMKAIMGVSGSGKSTLMNIIGLLDKPTTGQYFFLNDDVSLLSANELAKLRNRKIGFVFQSFYLLPRLNALQNVMLPLFYQHVPRMKAKEMALHMLQKMEVASFSHHLPHQLSGGQQQRVAIARALVNSPAVILADEPTGALDEHTSGDVMNLLVNLNQQEGRTILIITHDQAVSARCQQVNMIKDGRII